MEKTIKIASIESKPDQLNNPDDLLWLYYVPGDEEGRWILEDNAGVHCSNYNWGDVYCTPQDDDLLAIGEHILSEVEATIKADSGEPTDPYDAGAEARDIMRLWGWIEETK